MHAYMRLLDVCECHGLFVGLSVEYTDDFYLSTCHSLGIQKLNKSIKLGESPKLYENLGM